jgi:uncharacterized protein with von Willebrand factor type A (vWA) domain
MLPQVDDFLPVHNLKSLEQLVRALAEPAARRTPPPWRLDG